MADIHIEKVVDHLSGDMRRALEDTFHALAPQVKVDSRTAFKTFLKAVNRRHSTWVDIPDQFIEAKCRKCGEKF